MVLLIDFGGASDDSILTTQIKQEVRSTNETWHDHKQANAYSDA